MNRIGLSAGLSFWKLGGAGNCGGSLRSVAEMFDCTSSAAPSMLRSRSNCMTMLVVPSADDEVIMVMPGIVAKARSSGAGDRRGHRVRAGAGQLRGDRDGREIDARQRRDRQLRDSRTGRRRRTTASAGWSSPAGGCRVRAATSARPLRRRCALRDLRAFGEQQRAVDDDRLAAAQALGDDGLAVLRCGRPRPGCTCATPSTTVKT